MRTEKNSSTTFDFNIIIVHFPCNIQCFVKITLISIQYAFMFMHSMSDSGHQVQIQEFTWRRFFARTLGKSTESALPLLNLLDVLTVNNIYRLHILKFTHLWHKGLLPVLFQSYFQYASSIHGYNTRYASKQNLYKPKERTNSGKQTVAFAASVLWDNVPVDLKSLNVFNFSKKIKTLSAVRTTF